MTEAFMVLPLEKQNTIFLAAAKEFATKGYEKASTNNIVKDAGIGKGMLFYYFGSKLDLYIAVLKQLQVELGNLVEGMAIPEGVGVIETFEQLTKAKMQAVMEKPVWFDLVTRIYVHPEELSIAPEIQKAFGDMRQAREKRTQELFLKADMSRLRKDIPQERLMQHISFVMEGYSQYVTNMIKRMGTDYYNAIDNPFWDEYEIFTADLKTLLYEK